MLNCINGTVDSSRALDFGRHTVYIGENRANVLKINVADWTEQGAEGFRIAFEFSPYGGRVLTEKITSSSDGDGYLSGDFLYYPLNGELTSTGELRVQVLAFFNSGGKELIEKSGIGTITLLPSIGCPHRITEGSGTENPEETENPDEEPGAPDYPAQNDYGLLSVILTAKLLYIDDEQTPVYNASDAAEAASLAIDITSDFDEQTTRCAMIIVPAQGESEACLIYIDSQNGETRLGRYSGNSLLDLI